MMLGATDSGGMTTTPSQGPNAPLVTVNPYALPACGWGQKVTGSGPFTCSFDFATAAQEAFYAPAAVAGILAPGLKVNTPTGLVMLSAAIWGVGLYLLFGRKH